MEMLVRGDGRAPRGRGRHVHRLLGARRRTRPGPRRAAPLLRRERGVDGHRHGKRGSEPASRTASTSDRPRPRDAAGAADRRSSSTSRSSTPTSPAIPATTRRSSCGCVPAGSSCIDNVLQGGRVIDESHDRRERRRHPRPQRRHRRRTSACGWCSCRSATASAWCRRSDRSSSASRASHAPTGSRACPTASARPRRPAPDRAAPCRRRAAPARARRARRAVSLRARAELHDRDDALAPALVGHADDDRVEHGGVRLHRRLDLFGVHLLAAGVDRHRAPPEHGDGAVVLDARVVAGHRPAHAVDDGERRRGLLRVLVVAERARGRGGRACRRRRARPARRSSSSTVVSSLTRKRGAVSIGAAGGGDALALPARLRRAEAVDEDRAGQRLHPRLLHRRREDRAPGEHDGQRRQVERRVERVERLDQRTRERVADDDEERHLFVRDELPESRRGRSGGRARSRPCRRCRACRTRTSARCRA